MKDLTFLTYSLGCRTNQAEINEIGKELTKYGSAPSKKEPDVILINTCVVTAKAERETRKTIRHFRRVYPKAFLVVLGCGVDAKQKLKIKLPEADLFVENPRKEKTSKLIAQHFHLKKARQSSFQDKYFLFGRALLKIQEGCNQFCSFCIVPFLRGKPKSVAPEKIVSKVKKLENQGVKEVIVVGINLALYGKDLKPKTNLVKLLKKILKETKIERISLSSIEPDLINEELIKLLAKNKRLSPYFHLALQSGSPPVLKRMGRKTDLKKLLKLLLTIKQKIPEFTFRADILVGFPQESEKEFHETVDFVKKAKISFAHIFPYSKRPKTSADALIKKGIFQDLPKETKKQRTKVLKSVVEKIRLKEGEKLISKTFPCLFTQKENSLWKTLAPNSWPVKVLSKSKNLRGKTRWVKIIEVDKDSLIGNLTNFSYRLT